VIARPADSSPRRTGASVAAGAGAGSARPTGALPPRRWRYFNHPPESTTARGAGGEGHHLSASSDGPTHWQAASHDAAPPEHRPAPAARPWAGAHAPFAPGGSPRCQAGRKCDGGRITDGDARGRVAVPGFKCHRPRSSRYPGWPWLWLRQGGRGSISLYLCSFASRGDPSQGMWDLGVRVGFERGRSSQLRCISDLQTSLLRL